MTPLLALEELGEGPGSHLLTMAGQTALRGGECIACRKRFFPLKQLCPYCSAAAPSVIALPTQGRLYAYTTVHVSQGRPTPYRIGYVDLEGDVRVLTNVFGGDELTIDAPVQFVVTAEGAWAFEPMNAVGGARI